MLSSNVLQVFTELNLMLDIRLLCLPLGSEEEPSQLERHMAKT
jgi:hypothetical protein